MSTNMYCIYDKTASEIFGGIMIAKNDEVARRAFHEGLSNNEALRRNAHDYELVQLGAIDTETLAINGDDNRINVIASGADWLEANKEK